MLYIITDKESPHFDKIGILKGISKLTGNYWILLDGMGTSKEFCPGQFSRKRDV